MVESNYLLVSKNTMKHDKEATTYTKKVAYNTLIQIVGKILTTATSLVLIASLTRYLGVYGYGQYTTIFSYVSFAAVFADLGFFWIMVRELSKPDQKDHEKIFNNIMTLRSILGLIVFVVGFFISFLIPAYDTVIRYGIGIISIGWFIITVNSTYVGLFQSKHKMDRATLAEVIGRLIILGFVLFFIKTGYGLLAIVSAYTIGNAVNLIVNMIFGSKYVNFHLEFDTSIWKQMFLEAWPMGIVLVLHIIYLRVDSVMLSIMKTPEDVGIYGAPYKILEILILVPGIFMGNVFPIITRYFHEKSDKIYDAIQKSFDFLSILAIPIVVGVFMLATPIISLVAGEQFLTSSTIGDFMGHFANSALTLQVLIFATGIIFFSNIFSSTAVAIHKQKKLVWPNVIFALANVVLNLILIPKLSYIGASIATVITEFLVLLIIWQVVYKYLPKLKINFKVFTKAFLATIVMGIVIYIMGNINMFIIIPVAVIVYFATLYLFGGYDKNTIKMLTKKSN